MSFTSTHHNDTYPAISPKDPKLSAEGKVVLVTGGGSGIGKAIATSFVTAGAKAVAILGRTEATLSATKDELEKLGKSEIKYFVADAVDADAVDKVFTSLRGTYGKVDVAVSNAGTIGEVISTIEKTPIDDIWRSFEVNTKSVIVTAKAFVREAPEGATFINISSAAAVFPHVPDGSSYATSKLAAIKYMEYFQAENQHLRVFNVQPGSVDTQMNKKYGRYPATDAPELPADFCVWLANGDSDYLKGRFVFANWDVEELKKKEKEIVEKNQLVTNLSGLFS